MVWSPAAYGVMFGAAIRRSGAASTSETSNDSPSSAGASEALLSSSAEVLAVSSATPRTSTDIPRRSDSSAIAGVVSEKAAPAGTSTLSPVTRKATALLVVSTTRLSPSRTGTSSPSIVSVNAAPSNSSCETLALNSSSSTVPPSTKRPSNVALSPAGMLSWSAESSSARNAVVCASATAPTIPGRAAGAATLKTRASAATNAPTTRQRYNTGSIG